MTLSLSRIESAEPSWKRLGAVAGLQEERAARRRPRRGARSGAAPRRRRRAAGRRASSRLDAREVRARRARSGSGRPVGRARTRGIQRAGRLSHHRKRTGCVERRRQRGVALPRWPLGASASSGARSTRRTSATSPCCAPRRAMGRFDLLEVTVARRPLPEARPRRPAAPRRCASRWPRPPSRTSTAGRGLGPRAAPRRARPTRSTRCASCSPRRRRGRPDRRGRPAWRAGDLARGRRARAPGARGRRAAARAATGRLARGLAAATRSRWTRWTCPRRSSATCRPLQADLADLPARGVIPLYQSSGARVTA